jgi:DNA-binding NarL/FixJ family response regulator
MRSKAPSLTATLTRRQLLVLQMAADGHTISFIAALLEINEHTVRDHVKKCKRKLGARSLTQAAAIAAKRGLVSIPRQPDSSEEI